MDMSSLSRQFELEIRDKMIRAKKECHYNPTRFNQMLSRYGGVGTAKHLIASAIATGNTSDGFGTLCICGRLDLTFEDSVCKAEYASLFTESEIAYCRQALGK